MKKIIVIVIAALAASFVFSFALVPALAGPGDEPKPMSDIPEWAKPQGDKKPKADPPPKDKAKPKGNGCPKGTKPCKHTGTCIGVAKFDKECKPKEEDKEEEEEDKKEPEDCDGFKKVPDESTEDPDDMRCPNRAEETQQALAKLLNPEGGGEGLCPYGPFGDELKALVEEAKGKPITCRTFEEVMEAQDDSILIYVLFILNLAFIGGVAYRTRSQVGELAEEVAKILPTPPAPPAPPSP